MAIWDKILGKKDAGLRTQPAALPSADAASENTPLPQEIAPREERSPERAGEKRGKNTGVLVAPHVTEKATDLAERGVYILRVATGATKRTVAEAVAGRYGVAVEQVRMIVQPAKERRRGRQIGWKSGFKKAMVQLKEGQRIETL